MWGSLKSPAHRRQASSWRASAPGQCRSVESNAQSPNSRQSKPGAPRTCLGTRRAQNRLLPGSFKLLILVFRSTFRSRFLAERNMG